MKKDGNVSQKTFNSTITSLAVALFFLFLILGIIAIISLILSSISMTRTSNLSSNKADIANFTQSNCFNGTLYKNSFMDNIVFLDPVPICWMQIGKTVEVRLPFIFILDSLVGVTQTLELHILQTDALPFVQPDVLPWGSSSSVTVSASIFFINNNGNTRMGDISIIQYPDPDGQSFIYNLNTLQNGDIPDDSSITIRGGLVQYETSVYSNTSTQSFINQFSTSQVIQSISQGGKLPPLVKKK